MNNKIIVNVISDNRVILTFYKDKHKIIETIAYIGRNGITKNKIEGDGKTPIGNFELGKCFGTHKLDMNNYIQINDKLYWVDDSNSKYYNQLVDITKIKKDWNSAEHLIDYPEQYEYAIEIKTNPNNIPGRGSAVFLHCSVGKPTAGCIAIEKDKIKEILKQLEDGIIIEIKESDKKCL